MAEIIGVKTGAKLYQIADADGEILCEFKMNPSDSNLLNRLKVFETFMKDYVFEDVESVEGLAKINSDLSDQIETLVGCKGIFDKVGVLTLMEDGHFFYESVVSAVADVIKKETDRRTAKAKKVLAATAKYNK